MPILPNGPTVRAGFLSVFIIPILVARAPAHEAWLLTPAEIEALVAAPMPNLFASHLWLGLAALAGGAITWAALRVEHMLAAAEARWTAPLVRCALSVGPLVLRIGLALMLILAALGGLPRHGTAPWTEPTFLVPDMQLGLVPGWGWLAVVQVALALFLLSGAFTRWAGCLLILLSGLGIVVFGYIFLSYAPHFAAPGLMLILAGGGALSCDRMLGCDGWVDLSPGREQGLWRLAQILIGAGFVYLAVVHKLTQPTLLIAIVKHSSLPTFGLPLPVVALIMTGIEIVCGILLILGRLVRPVAVLLIAAFSIFAVALSETPLFHANLYGAMILLALSGRALPFPSRRRLRSMRGAVA
ncbi:DoxX family membrane protein [Actibacterium sp. 188UL27-1]|uniref:DoxX family membrane protein n=1 Tax=Actibacterium sp. 188UL27-1 TaxID=2786961 RepID=UPI001959ABA1|nr:DoxX family membrane protein [Actibacterium sp. 188UL27-1]MBM7066914.1 DoxX family membrane protein [Actibacterium sp. 188UL27-1]